MGLTLTAAGGYLASTALSQEPGEPTRTVTVDVAGPTGPQGPPGPAGEQGPPGSQERRAGGHRRPTWPPGPAASSPASPGTAPASSS